MSAFEKIIQLETDFDNRKVELLELRNRRIRETEEEIRVKREQLQAHLKAEVDKIRTLTEQKVKLMQSEAEIKINADRDAFNAAFAQEKAKIVAIIFDEVKAL